MATPSTATIAARIDRLPQTSLVRKLIVLISLGGWFEFYDLFFTAAVGAGMVKSGLFKVGPNPFETGSLASFVASLFAGLFMARSASPGSRTVSGGARSSPSLCSGIRSALSSSPFSRARPGSISGA